MNLRDDPSLIGEHAQEAFNCDLFKDKIEPQQYYGIKETVSVEATNAQFFPHYRVSIATWDDYVFHNRFVKWKVENHDMLIYHDNGERPQKYVREVSINGAISFYQLSSGILGQDIPIAPSALPIAASIPFRTSGGSIPEGIQNYAMTLDGS